MKILSAEDIRELDKYTIQHEPVSSVDLMERAATKFFEAVRGVILREQEVYVFCGQGNNGGDGLAVSRMLNLAGYKNVKTFVVEQGGKKSPDFEVNEARLKAIKDIAVVTSQQQIPAIKKTAVIIDAIFGTGLTREVEGLCAEVIGAINESGAVVYSIDIPSGLYCDKLNNPNDVIINSTSTYTFHSPKLTFLFPQNEKFVPSFEILDIGLSKEFNEQPSSSYEFLDGNLIKRLIKKRSKFSHKGTYGHALISAGSYGKMGAAILSVKAALHSGAGLVTASVPKCGYQMMQITNPEAMVLIDDNENILTEMQEYSKFSALGIGPGIGDQSATADLLENILRRADIPLVLDADALNIISQYHHLKDLIPFNTIITPHPGEFKRLVWESKDDMLRLQKQMEFSQQYKTVVVLKGANTSISTPDGKVYFNSTGNPGMAKGGSGDVLTGIITSLRAQGYSPEHAAVIGVFIHGLAGDIAAKKQDRRPLQRIVLLIV